MELIPMTWKYNLGDGKAGMCFITRKQFLHIVIEGMQGLISAVMVFNHFHRRNFAIWL